MAALELRLRGRCPAWACAPSPAKPASRPSMAATTFSTTAPAPSSAGVAACWVLRAPPCDDELPDATASCPASCFASALSANCLTVSSRAFASPMRTSGSCIGRAAGAACVAWPCGAGGVGRARRHGAGCAGGGAVTGCARGSCVCGIPGPCMRCIRGCTC
eukprot:920932-Alexandrium_andersonii.AAC.1